LRFPSPLRGEVRGGVYLRSFKLIGRVLRLNGDVDHHPTPAPARWADPPRKGEGK